jgi:nucleotide-binding universal stress UspA family protein
MEGSDVGRCRDLWPLRRGPVGEHASTMFTNIVVGVDGSASSRKALRWSFNEARALNARLVVVMAWHYPAVVYIPLFATGVAPVDAMQAAAEMAVAALVADELGEGAGVVIEPIAVWSSPRQALVDQVEPGTLLVLGHHERTQLNDLLFGWTTDSVIQQVSCPVVVIPAS